MIIGVCGYTGSGSSAVTDYLKEFESVQVMDDFEFTIIHSPDGIEDLDYQLNEQCSKYTASSTALFRFERCVYDYLIRLTKNKQVKRKLYHLTEQYIESLTQVKWKGFGIADLQLYKSKWSMLPFLNATRILRKWPGRLGTEWTSYPSRDMRLSIKPHGFDELSRQYIISILEALGADFSKTVVIDQLFAGNVPEKGFKYFDNPYAIIVDRDPRDMYIFAKEYYHRKGFIYQIPTETVEQFILYYSKMRESQNHISTDRTLTIQFEDMIYEYENTTAALRNFCNITDKQQAGIKRFDPQKSIQNTQVFKRFPQYSDDIMKIQNELGQYLYPFDRYAESISTGSMFDKA